MPAHIFEFASNPDNHDLTNHNSLHDSWLESWNVAEKNVEGSRDRAREITACLLGPYHDRYIHLAYRNVQTHSIQNSDLRLGSITSPHGDLLVHELTMVREGLFSHELIFANGPIFFVEFADLEHRIEMIAKP